MKDLLDRDQAKRKIVELFNQRVKGRKSTTLGMNKKHDGKEGHWLEQQMGIKANAKNAPDLFGFEMKNDTNNKTTFGDWSASYYLFKCRKNSKSDLTRDKFLEIFGKSNLEKDGRFSWSGEPCPKIDKYNRYGQILVVDNSKSVLALYDYRMDERENKQIIVPKEYQEKDLILAKWDYLWMKKKVEKKFNQNGWFKCLKDKNGVYDRIVFGDPINYDIWIDMLKKGLIFFDSGMYQTNSRNYSQWRASNKIWDELVRESF